VTDPLAQPRRPERGRARRTPKGRVVNPQAMQALQACLASWPTPWQRHELIEYLHAIQDQQGGLPKDWLVALAHALRLAPVHVMEVASFYHHFTVLPDGQWQDNALPVRVCTGLSCAMQGAQALQQQLSRDLQHTTGRSVHVQPVPCVGRCEQAPAVQLGQLPVPCATPQSVAQHVQQLPTTPMAQWGGNDFRQHAPHLPEPTNLATYREQGGYALWTALRSDQLSGDEVLRTVQQAGLRGMGGAGFAAARKWQAVRAEAGPRLLAVNADEGEPGTFKDRVLLESEPHRLLEGMLVAAHVVGCEQGYIYLRDEYPYAHRVLRQALHELQAWQGHDVLPITLRRGAGAYICGEESAMIESLEGKRGEPRLRPPYVAQRGLFGRPTLVHNVETLMWLPELHAQGAAWFAAHGRQGRQGLRRYSLSGRVNRPGVYLAPAGISVQELINEYGGGMPVGHTLYGYLPGGASGGMLPAGLAHVPLDFDTLQPHGAFIGSAAVVVLSQHDRARDAALNTMQFFSHESCGQCTPCRVGTDKAVHLMQQPQWDTSALNDLADVMREASICGLGQAAPNAWQSVQQHFAHELKPPRKP
jgi:NADH:ubiquinone oxidoreductase subunit F (NADH-binding)/NADH:ubiquinone oxidoreductase subunit E